MYIAPSGSQSVYFRTPSFGFKTQTDTKTIPIKMLLALIFPDNQQLFLGHTGRLEITDAIQKLTRQSHFSISLVNQIEPTSKKLRTQYPELAQLDFSTCKSEKDIQSQLQDIQINGQQIDLNGFVDVKQFTL